MPEVMGVSFRKKKLAASTIALHLRCQRTTCTRAGIHGDDDQIVPIGAAVHRPPQTVSRISADGPLRAVPPGSTWTAPHRRVWRTTRPLARRATNPGVEVVIVCT